MKKQLFYRRVFIGEDNEKWDEVRGNLITFPNIPGKFFSYKTSYCGETRWRICELTTGYSIGFSGKTRKEVVEFAYNQLILNLPNLQNQINFLVKKNGLPPYPVE